jgi:putative Mn2+ efflux pump MntP
MGTLELILLSVGLAMDAFAVSVCKGLALQKIRFKHMLICGAWFGGFQALMPLLGWLLGSRFSRYIEKFDHWIAFILLALIGANMIREAVSGKEEDVDSSLKFGEMFLMAVATSIDALAVGVSFAFLNVSIVPAVTCIGVITFVISAIGVKIGSIFGARYKARAEIAGGVILIIIGLRILLQHLGILA